MNASAHSLHRCFYAVPFSLQVNQSVAELIADLRRYDDGAVGWTPPQNIHLTLRFLGELDDRAFNEAQRWLLDQSFDYSLRLKIIGLDAFPSPRKPSVLILSAEGSAPEDQRALLELQQRTEEFARQIGLEPEVRPFRPHITLGRVRQNRSISPALRNALIDMIPQRLEERETTIESIRLIESTLKPRGAEYRVVAERVLGNKG